jgi:hypothetical protein
MYPELTESCQSLFRVTYGVCMLCTLAMALPHYRRFFLSERWGGYAQSTWEVNALHNPIAAPVTLAAWIVCLVLLTAGVWTAPTALVNLLLCRYYFIHMRWKGVLRGMGAPGFMSYWVGAAVFLLEFTSAYMPDLRWLALLVIQIDFALIMLSAGIYKFTAGYPRNHGMEGGMVNPEWGYWSRFYARMSPRSPLFWILNQLAWSVEIVAALMMLWPNPWTRFWGAILIASSFVFIATQIRLGLLCQMVIICALLFFHPGTPGQAWLDAHWSGAGASNPELVPPTALLAVVAACLWAYLTLLPFAHVGLYYNFYGRRALPRPLQCVLDKYTNFFGIIIWRVFSVDHVSFFPLVYTATRFTGERALISRYEDWTGRFTHVGEAICLTSLFTTLKYYPDNPALFTERLLRYSRTLECPPDRVLLFQYVTIRKAPHRFEQEVVAEFIVDLMASTVTENKIVSAFDLTAAHASSPLHAGVRPGSYAPAAT